MNKELLKALSDKTFFDNDTGEIQPKDHRRFNDELIAAVATTDEVCGLVPYVGENLILQSNTPIRQSGRALFYLVAGASGINGDTTMTIETSAQANVEVVYRDAQEVTVATIGTVVCEGVAILHSMDIPATADRVAIYTTNPNAVVRVKLERGTKSTPWAPAYVDTTRIMDHSILSEQIVPGEFWPGDQYGLTYIPSQAYTQTVLTSFYDSPSDIPGYWGIDVASGIKSAVIDKAFIVGPWGGDNPFLVLGTEHPFIIDIINDGVLRILYNETLSSWGGMVAIVVKYTKR